MRFDRRTGGIGILILLSGLAGWLERRPPEWIAGDPLVEPFGRSTGPDRVAELDSILDPPTPEPAPPRVIDPNRATRDQWIALPGIGPALADRIGSWLATGRAFRRAEDLEQVPGIGPARLEQLRPWLRFPMTSGDSSSVRSAAQ